MKIFKYMVFLCPIGLVVKIALWPIAFGLVNKDLKTITYVDQIDQSRPACRDFTNYIEQELNTSGFILGQNNKILAEKYYRTADRPTKTKMWSISKTLSGLTLGALIRERGVEFLEKSLAEIGIQRKPQPGDQVKWEEVKLKHIWRLSSGIDWCEYETCDGVDALNIMYLDGHRDALSYVLKQKLLHRPGTRFQYSSGDYVLLQRVFQLLVPNQEDYLALTYEKILRPIGVKKEEFSFETDHTGLIQGGFGLHITASALYRVGKLLLQKGHWEGNEIISSEFFEQMKKVSPAILKSPKAVQSWEGPVGGSIWLNDDSLNGEENDRAGVPSIMPTSPRNLMYAGGHLGQNLLIYPSSGIVFVRTGGDLNFLRQWKELSEKMLACLAPEELREDYKSRPKLVPPHSHKKMDMMSALQANLFGRHRAQELCSCLYITGYKSVSACDQMVPNEFQVFWKITNYDFLSSPALLTLKSGVRLEYRGGFAPVQSVFRSGKIPGDSGCRIQAL